MFKKASIRAQNDRIAPALDDFKTNLAHATRALTASQPAKHQSAEEALRQSKEALTLKIELAISLNLSSNNNASTLKVRQPANFLS